MRRRGIVLAIVALSMFVAVVGQAWAFSGVVNKATCGLDSCHTHPGHTDFTSWHTSHQSPDLAITCDWCHPNNHTTTGPPSAPEATYSLSEACGDPCHAEGMVLAPGHAGAGVMSCASCHPPAGDLTGVVSDGNGPLAGVTVTVEGAVSGRTYGAGDYVIPRVPVGMYTVTYSKTGYIPRVLTGVSIAFAEATVRDVRLTAYSGTTVLLKPVRSVAWPAFGAPAQFTVRLTTAGAPEIPVPGFTVVIDRLVSGSWEQVATCTPVPGLQGMCSVTVMPSDGVRTLFRARLAPNAWYSATPVLLVAVPHARVGAPRPSMSAVGRDAAFTVAGAVSPARPHIAIVEIHRRGADGRFGPVARRIVLTDAAGSYRVRLRMSVPGTYRFRTSVGSDSLDAEVARTVSGYSVNLIVW